MKKYIFLLFLLPLSLSGREGNTAKLDLSPARWVWYPSGRTLQNTFVLFRKEFDLEKDPMHAQGWILADSRYQLFVNGQRVQWGPAPSDPRWQEADPMDLTPYLKPGKNVIACQVCFFGTGDGTHPMGKPGFLFHLDVDGQQIISDDTWYCHLAKSWQPGKYKRWFLRALQEEFDARLFPYGWSENGFAQDESWVRAKITSNSGAVPSVCSWSSEYAWEIFGDPSISEIRGRGIPMMEEYEVPVWKLTESMHIRWRRPAEDYFDMIIPDAFTVEETAVVSPDPANVYRLEPPRSADHAVALTFEFREQGVGWPQFTIDAPEGTIIELLVHEAHKPGGPPIINSHFNAWTRFICREGINHFETFDFESLRWLQLHIRNFDRPVTVSGIGMRRRVYPWESTPAITLSDTLLQRIMEANINTLYNCAQETLVDGMARERQQYSGDGSHQMHTVFQGFGDVLLPRRYVNTFSQGSSIDGYFMDSWPAWDRLARTVERQMQLTGWGPIIDHSVGFCFDSYHYYMYTGDKEGLAEVYPRLVKFFGYLESLTDEADGLVPAEGLGMCSVYIDHEAYKKQRHKQLALNLYIAAMCRNALPVLSRLFGDEDTARHAEHYADGILDACIRKFWDDGQGVFVCNLPWAAEEGEVRYCDRSLATSVLYGQCPGGNTAPALEILSACPPEMGFSYPCNAVWRQWALAENGRMDVVLDDMRERWGKMTSIWENNTLQEFWVARHDEGSQWSHCAVGPLMMLYQGIAGVVPLEPGSAITRVRPQPGDLEHARFDIRTLRGPVGFESKGRYGKREITLDLPDGCDIELWLDAREKIVLPYESVREENGMKKFTIKGGRQLKLKLKHT